MGKTITVLALIGCMWLGYDTCFTSYSVEKVQVTVQPNDTLWSLCGRYYDQDERRINFDDYVYSTKYNNKMKSSMVYPGDVVTIEVHRKK